MKRKKDKFYRLRGGSSIMMRISCSNCGEFVCDYQKDGAGNLFRLYLDRIVNSNAALQIPELKNGMFLSNLKPIVCICRNPIAIPRIYKREQRLAYVLKRCSINKTKIK